MISCSSSFASSTPATSLKVTFFCCEECSRARLFPKLRALLPPLCICRIMKIHKPKQNQNGNGIEQNADPAVAGGILPGVLHTLVLEDLPDIGVVRRNLWCGTRSRRRECPVHRFR